MTIKLIALDLDGTTMNSSNHLSAYNKEAIEEALRRNIDVVVTTGRSYNSLPDEVMKIEGLEYAITSNGAFINDLINGSIIHACYIEQDALRDAVKIAREYNIDIEVFWNGQAYTNRSTYEAILNGAKTHRNVDYVRKSRKPVDDVYEILEAHGDEIENINFNLMGVKNASEAQARLEGIPKATKTSSIPENLEFGGPQSTKRKALEILSEKLGYDRSEIMSFGDARNDIPMIELAGIGVAVGNAWDEVKEVADYIAETNDNDGVGRTIRKFCFGQE